MLDKERWITASDGAVTTRDVFKHTHSHLEKAFIICSGLSSVYLASRYDQLIGGALLGSEAMEAAMKMARQYYVEKGQLQRQCYRAREHSYHGTTLGALSMSGHVT